MNETFTSIRKSELVILAGDFNAKAGQKQGEKCIGRFSKGKRNSNEDKLIEFCEDNKLFITNSAFNHPSRHITTWTGQWRDKITGKLVNIFNQIDYIIVPNRQKHLLTNARSYAGTTLTSDHKLLKTSLKIEQYKLWKANYTKGTPKLNVSKLPDQIQAYKEAVNTHLATLDKQNSPNETWYRIQDILRSAAHTTVGTQERHQQNREPSKQISELSRKQKELRIKSQNTSDEEKKAELKKERNKVLHDIRKKVIEEREREIEIKISDIDTAQNGTAMFKAVKLLNLDRKYEAIKVEDESGKVLAHPNDKLNIVTNFFESKFQNPNKPFIEASFGEPRKLKKPITKEEVRKSINKLNNNRAPGKDGIQGELLKYGPETIDSYIANIINESFEKHEILDINAGEIIPLPKPGKPKGPPKNLRPITLLNTIPKNSFNYRT